MKQINIYFFLFLLSIFFISNRDLFGQGSATGLGTSLDRIIQRQDLVIENTYFGSQALLKDRQKNLSIFVYMGVYGSEGILGGYGLSFQAARFFPWGAGVSFSVGSSDFVSRSLNVNVQRELFKNKNKTLVLQNVIGYQWKANDKLYFTLKDPSVYFNHFNSIHNYFHLLFKFHFILLNGGFTLTRYFYEGNEWSRQFLDETRLSNVSEITVESKFGAGLTFDILNFRFFLGARKTVLLGNLSYLF